MRLKLLSLSVMTIGAAALSGQALASGYNFGSQSVSAQGTAHANGAEAADPSTIYYNPAGLSNLDGTQIQIGLTSVMPSSSYTDGGSTRAAASIPISGSKTANNYVPSHVEAPTLYLSSKLNDKWTVGLGIFVPYGAQLNYGSNWIGRYSVENIKLETLNFNPSIAFKLDEQNSFGFGVSAQYMKAHLTKAVDSQSLAAALNGGPWTLTLPQILALGDGQADMTADGWGYGFNLGYMFKLDDHTRFGLAYRSQIKHTLDGNVKWTYDQVGNAAVAGVMNNLHSSSGASTDVTTPASASANFYHDINDKLAVMGNVTWTEHSDMDKIAIQFPGTGKGNMVINQNWKDSWLYALGLNYKYNDALTLRTGVALDKSPANSQYISAALPDGDRTWLSLGANYKFDKNQSIDFSYSYVWVKDVDMNYYDVCYGKGTGCTLTGNGENTVGKYKTTFQMIGLAYNYRF
ncbi:OmpP1/FadL family transporter [Paludibacterium sp. THUN1379]|uniref:OmpP1/FadL family transporter n=1 Tax=Paludibacterium sp. THUN1379 TaxID=3112107 RepID=UPI00308F7584|nr:OmpP1/FadL family transporter [Paludibacterium sp. THUN1379]